MKITLVTETFPPEVKGVAMTLQRIARGLAGMGHQVRVVRPRHAGEAKPPACSGNPSFLVLPGFPTPGYPGLRIGLPAGRRLRQEWRSERPDLVHVATEGPLGWSACRAAKSLGLPLTTSFHTNFHSYTRDYRLGFMERPVRAYLRRVHRRARVTFVPTDEMISELTELGFGAMKRMSRGVDNTLFNPSRRNEEMRMSWGASPDTPVVLFTSRIAREKNLPAVFETFAELRAREPRLRLVIVGDGPLASRLQHHHPEAIYCGMRFDEDLARHYASADLFLFPSLSETFGNVILEAMASGLPVVAYDYAAARLFIKDGVNGFLAPFGNPIAFTATALQALRRRNDWPQIGRRAVETAAAVPWRDVLQTFEQDLLEVVARPAAFR